MEDLLILYVTNNFDQCYHSSNSTNIYLEGQIWERLSGENDHSVFYNMVLCSNFEVKPMILVS